MRPALTALLLSAACFSPVGEANGGAQVSGCVGAGCPWGECRDCVSPPAGCDSPECALQRVSCAKALPCGSYGAYAQPFPATGRPYCLSLLGDPGRWAVDAEGAATSCPAPKLGPCDAGQLFDELPAGCTVCAAQKRYCIGG